MLGPMRSEGYSTLLHPRDTGIRAYFFNQDVHRKTSEPLSDTSTSPNPYVCFYRSDAVSFGQKARLIEGMAA